ncbi:MAG: GNAT family N-acetyltransferase [Rhodobacteraceae bacterium]|nr:GNAT family N-acetyltransferase [Paracoccaceae bacterium]
MERQKLVLLRSARKKGVFAFVKQFIRTVRDSFWSKRQMIYSVDLATLKAPDMCNIQGLSYRRISDWSELSEENYNFLNDTRETMNWGNFSWLTELEYGLWVAEVNGKLAAVKWWRSYEQSSDFFVRIPKNTELHWQTTVFPEFRGQKLLEAVLITVMEYRKSQGIEFFMISCRDYNMTSRRVFVELGCLYLGYAETNKLTKKEKWHPLLTPIPAAEFEMRR